MNARKMLCSLFASLSLGAAGAAAAQEAPQTPPTAPAAITTAASTTDAPWAFNVRDYFLKNQDGVYVDSRGPRYLCGDNTNHCWSDEQRSAWAVREFKLMMQATLYSCSQFYPNEPLIEHYNRFISNNEATLQSNFHVVASYYIAKSATPRDAMIEQENLESATGNIFSGAAGREYCEKSVTVLRHVSQLQDDAAVVQVAHRLLLTPRPPAA